MLPRLSFPGISLVFINWFISIFYTDYVDDIKQLLFSMTKQERDTIRAQYKAKIPEPLTNQFTDRVSKDTAIKRHEARKELRTELFPSGEVFTKNKNIYIYLIINKQSCQVSEYKI